ncbi:MAG: 2OG-Fe(II) oxygenase, partial [Alphaproteobacteria bacterium]
MTDSAAITDQFLDCLDGSRQDEEPYRHWRLGPVLTDTACAAVAGLPFAPPPIGDTAGKRETHNSTRTFFSPENRHRFEVCEAISQTLQNETVVRRLERTCGVSLTGSHLRIEYCQDVDGFWLESHTDISVKLFTMLVHLS